MTSLRDSDGRRRTPPRCATIRVRARCARSQLVRGDGGWYRRRTHWHLAVASSSPGTRLNPMGPMVGGTGSSGIQYGIRSPGGALTPRPDVVYTSRQIYNPTHAQPGNLVRDVDYQGVQRPNRHLNGSSPPVHIHENRCPVLYLLARGPLLSFIQFGPL